MPKQIQKQRAKAERTSDQAQVEPTHVHSDHAETDKLLDEIDEALGENLENAQAFIAANVQKGGE